MIEERNDIKFPACFHELFYKVAFCRRVRSIEFIQPAGIIKIDDKVVAFTLGEALGDMLYIHIEKADREYAGLGETLTSEFAADIISEMPQIKLINREEDLGNEGLRQAKRAYNPIAMLNRYEFTPAK